MNHLKNLAGNDVSIFLFRFELSGNGISFVLNEAIAADMYRDVAQCQLLFNISDNYILTSAEWPPDSVTVSGAR